MLEESNPSNQQPSSDRQGSSSAVPSQGTTLEYKDGDWKRVVNLSDISGFNGSAAMTDVTHLGSKGKEKRPGLQDWGQVTIALNINLREASHSALLAAKRKGEALDFKLTLSEKSTIEFRAFVKDFPISAKVDQMLTGSVNLEITGDVTVTPAPAAEA
ncbi:phage tail tube protein [Paraburkholderia caribensis]|uniref:phage tail tube protein n=1 Tax=Paraburkholderia caribensis TaxID=75105 RepID=UPI001CACE5CA|nr:phage tail tube protein [Paraburkholderia caribensis]CAG9262208.1 Phage major tail protein 2 [Paraburkholderia caribensis]